MSRVTYFEALVIEGDSEPDVRERQPMHVVFTDVMIFVEEICLALRPHR